MSTPSDEDVHGGAASLAVLLPQDVVLLVEECRSATPTSALSKAVLLGSCQSLIDVFLGEDDSGFWLAPGPERLMCLSSTAATRGCRGASAQEVYAAEQDVLGGSTMFSEDGALLVCR